MATEVTVATRLVLVCNPNNPTSTAVGLDEIEAFMRRIPSHVAVILDEAYCEYSLTLGDTYASLDLLRRYPNLVLLRTFSKVYGLAALRVGYGLCGAEDFRIAVDQVRQPFYVNSAAQAAGVEALKHQDEVERRVTATIASRLAMEDAVRALGLWVAQSDANFIWLHLPETVEEADVVAGLRDRGVLVRAGAALGREGSLRVTVGTDAENDRFADALATVLAG
jgi:histidinol-phosphate aminotransferase